MQPLKLLLFSFMFIYFLSENLLATTLKMPENIRKKLCYELSGGECSLEQELHYGGHGELANGKLLLFFYLYDKQTMYKHGYANTPVIVDTKGKWKIIRSSLRAEIREIAQDPNGGIWVRTLWMIEGLFPSLYYTKNGVKWQEITFPQNQEVISSFKDLRICLLGNEVELTFHSMDDKPFIKTWETSYADAVTPNPKWKEVNTENRSKSACRTPANYKSVWKFQQNRETFDTLFTHKEQKVKLVLPYKISVPPKSLYSIQVAVFKYKKSLDIALKKMGVSHKNLIHKEVKKGGVIQYKLFLDSFSTKREAQERLNSLKKQYKTDSTFKGAFVTQFPKD